MSIYDFKVKKADGSDQSLADYKGDVMLIVNVASKCGFTPQYEGLEQLYQDYKDRNFIILGFPCNQFLHQEPGDNNEIQQFCKMNYGVTFPIMAKIDVNGKDADPLYKYLEEQKGYDKKNKLADAVVDVLKKIKPDYEHTDDIKWNFTKFLVDKQGNVLKRYESSTKPEDIKQDIEKALLD